MDLRQRRIRRRLPHGNQTIPFIKEMEGDLNYRDEVTAAVVGIDGPIDPPEALSPAHAAPLPSRLYDGTGEKCHRGPYRCPARHVTLTQGTHTHTQHCRPCPVYEN